MTALILVLWLNSSLAETAGVKECLSDSGKRYYSDDCQADSTIGQVKLRKITRLDPAPENPITGLWAYYKPLYLKARIKLRQLGLIDSGW